MMRLLIGTYTDDGLVSARIEANSDAPYLGVVDAELPHMSYAATHPHLPLVYCVEEREPGRIHILRPSGSSYQKVASLPSGGAAPCFVSVSNGGSWLAVANYNSGSVGFQRLNADGFPYGQIDIRKGTGSGPNRDRQEGPHAHCVRFSPDGKFAYSTDLGSDRIYGYPCGSRRIEEAFMAYAAPMGDGPRHLVFHPEQPLAYLLCELSSRLLTLRINDDGQLQAIHSIFTLPTDSRKNSLAGHLEIDADRRLIFVTNRGHDSLTVFTFDAHGTPIFRQTVKTGHASPRHFLRCPNTRRVFVAHEEGDWISILRETKTGTLAGTEAGWAVKRPAFLLALSGCEPAHAPARAQP